MVLVYLLDNDVWEISALAAILWGASVTKSSVLSLRLSRLEFRILFLAGGEGGNLILLAIFRRLSWHTFVCM